MNCFFCDHNSDKEGWVLCLISMHHSTMLLLRFQCCCLLIWREWKRVNCWWMPFVCCFFLNSPLRSSAVSVAFDFNASHNDVAPVSLMWLAVDLMKVEKLIICEHFFFFFDSHLKSSSVNVVFVFNASLNDVAPVSPMLLPVCLRWKRG